MPGVTIGYASPDFGFVVCSPTPIHGCVGTTPLRHGARSTPPVDIEVVPGCGTQAVVAPLCPGAFPDRTVLECYARHGVLLDTFAGPATGPVPRSEHFVLQCDEGIAEVDFIEPF